MAPTTVEGEFRGLLVKVSAENVSGEVKGKLYLIPESSLSQFEFAPTRGADFDQAFAGSNRLINVDYAVFRQDMIWRGSTG